MQPAQASAIRDVYSITKLAHAHTVHSSLLPMAQTAALAPRKEVDPWIL